VTPQIRQFREIAITASATVGTAAAADPSAAADPIDEFPGLWRLLAFGAQHMLVMYAGTVAVPLILGSALHLGPEQLIALISADLFTCGMATLLQTLGWSKFGSRLPLIQGCSFICVAPMILIGGQYGLPVMYGSVICGGLFVLIMGSHFSRMLRFFPPIVIGSIITVIGLSLLPVAGDWFGGGDPSSPDFGSYGNLGLGLGTVALIVIIQRFGNGLVANLSVLLGLMGGTALAWLTGVAHFARVDGTPWFGLIHPLLFGMPQFALQPGLVMCLAMLVVMAETTGNCLAIGEITGCTIDPPILAGALRADGLSTVLGGVFNSFPYNAFSQNTGLLALSNVKSRFAVAAAGGLLVVLGFLPKVAAVVGAMPRPVLGGAAIVMFGMTTMAGIRELAKVRYEGTHNDLIVAIVLSVGLIPIASPHLFAHAPDTVRLFLGSGILLAAATAVVLNLLLSRHAGTASRDGHDVHD
jgi:NCS2 family nucleobase:cation symporter-2